jgi:hypothetical protein
VAGVLAAFDCEISPDELETFSFQPSGFSVRTWVNYDGGTHSQGGTRNGLFVGNNPINLTDPLGLWSLSPRAREIIGGSLTIIGSVPTMIGGAALSSTGPGAVAGIPIMFAGATGFGLGMTQILHGISGDGPVNTPNGTVPGGMLGLGGAMTGNPNLQTFGDMGDSLFPLPTDAWASLTGANILLNPPEFDPNAWPFAPPNDQPSPSNHTPCK